MAEYHPFSDEVMQDPHPVYKRLRAESPVHYIEEYDAWAISKFDDIWNCSMDTKHFTASKGTTSAHLLTKVQPVTPMLNLMDPPEHTRLRAEIRSHLQPSNVARFEPMIRELASKALDDGKEKGGLDVMSEFASLVSVTVACSLIGIPLEDAPLMNDLVWRFFGREEGVEGMTADGLAAMEEMFGYFVQLSQSRKKAGAKDGDIIDIFNHWEIDGKKFDDMTIASHLSLFIIGGSETFPKTFATTIRRLGEHPEQRAQLAADSSKIPGAYIEALRYDMPTQFLCRVVTNEIEIRGQKLKPGQPVLFLYPSGNRDEEEFENPDVFDINRGAARVLSFGAGTHMCIGIHAAKLEGRVLIEEVLKRAPDYEIHLDKAERLVTDFVQGYATFPITF
ncbi:MAG: cytochrome P450 [Myxococcales bacterium]|nr:cytochrome P450 [Myxococcales bacterium]